MLGFAGLAGLAAGGAPARARDFWGEGLPDQPADFLFGYGTLISEPSRTATSRRRVVAVPARVSARFGLVRAFVSRGGARSGAGFTALGLRHPRDGEEPSSINGVVFPVRDAEEMAAFDRREGGYQRVEVDPVLVEAVGWQGLPHAGRVWIYVPKGIDLGREAGAPDNGVLPDAAFPLVQSYVDVVLQGALAEGGAFARELIETTFDWSPFWLDDRPTPRRPWAATEQAGAIDRLLASVEPAASQFRNRLYPELYAARHLMDATAPR
ncbi:gamma-glutamylcyclotransferase family protein [Xanthobacter oligotrophicus]|uniref:gamma-glutamylcyclotransferase family protein n=1 Tax=Xanthobacter oligotrophicus TaxID=2607286 RepID=UPI0011F299A2|nr:gamma-glutamylcyclotransferase family protein [Xanthobacter oligotrophicus]MCG5237300.1 gamma-glutamylcyclotransferase [Xanthobacter oligotrophicus]